MIERHTRKRHWQVIGFIFVTCSTLIAIIYALTRFRILRGDTAVWVTLHWPHSLLICAVTLILIRVARDRWVAWRYRKKTLQPFDDGVTFLVRPSAEADFTTDDMIKFWNQVSDLIPYRSYLIFGMSGNSSGITYHCCVDSARTAKLIQNNLRADFYGIQTENIDRHSKRDPFAIPEKWHVAQIALKPADWLRPISTQKGVQPLLTPMDALSRLPDDTRAGIAVFVRSGDPARHQITKLMQTERKSDFPDNDKIKSLQSRADRPLLETHFVTWIASSDKFTTQTNTLGVSRELSAQYDRTNRLKRYNGNTIITPNRITKKLPSLTFDNQFSRDFSLLNGQVMTDNDLALCMHLAGEKAYRLTRNTLKIAQDETSTAGWTSPNETPAWLK